MRHFIIIFILISPLWLTSQCFMNSHSTTWYDNWISCKPKISPNPVRPGGHWILYNLGYVYELKDSHWWNGNEADALHNGISNMAMDISDDGVNWSHVMDFELPQATGFPDYEGVEGPDFGGIEARYILLTALDNFGGECYSFGEMKINVDVVSKVKEEVSSAYCLQISAGPNPFTTFTNIKIMSNCGEKIVLVIEDGLGRTVYKTETTADREENVITWNSSQLSSGIYFVTAYTQKQKITQKLVKVE
jgi:hypothetical protein